MLDPVFVTSILPKPETTVVPARSEDSLPEVVVVFSTGKLSPVRVDSLTKKSSASMSRPSAAMMEPAARQRMSPGTMSLVRISSFCPERRAVTLSWSCLAILLAALADLNSW